MEIRIHTSDVWSVLSPLLRITLKASAGFPNPEAAIEVLTAVIKIIEGQHDTEILKSIDKKVQRLIDEHIKSGKDYLASATAKTIERHRRDAYLMQALDKFTSAKNLLPPPENIRAMTYAAICYQCLGDEENATKWFKDSYETAVSYWRNIVAVVQKIEKPSSLQHVANSLLGFVSIAVVLPIFLYNAIDDSTSRKHYDYLTRLFDIETQMRHLQQILASAGIQDTPFAFYFPNTVIRIEPKNFSKPNDLKQLVGFDENGIVGTISLGTRGKGFQLLRRSTRA